MGDHIRKVLGVLGLIAVVAAIIFVSGQVRSLVAAETAPTPATPAVPATSAAPTVAAAPAGSQSYYHEAGKGWSGILPTLPAPSFAPLVNKVKAAVVNISITKKSRMGSVRSFGMTPKMMPGIPGMPGGPGGQMDPFDDFFNKFFGDMPQQEREQHSLGSGFIINENGFIMTNRHVIKDADEVMVQTEDKKKYPAKIIGRDEKTDMAIIKIEGTNLPYVELGDSDALEIGDWVVAVGNPFGLSQTVTAGIVSAKGRVIGAGPYDDFIQTDASINPGNSGGPLFNTKGQVVGINTAIHAGGQGLGFAIPINMAKKVIPQLVQHGKVVDRGWLGVVVQEITPELAKSFNIKEGDGVLVGDVVVGSPAEKAGLKRGDLIKTFNGAVIKSVHELPIKVAETPPGQPAVMEVMRAGQLLKLTVQLGRQEGSEPRSPWAESGEGDDQEKGSADLLGLMVAGTNDNTGVKVKAVDPKGAAADAGIREGDLLLEVNGNDLKTVADYQAATKGLKKGNAVRLLVKREGATLFVAFILN